MKLLIILKLLKLLNHINVIKVEEWGGMERSREEWRNEEERLGIGGLWKCVEEWG